MRKLLLISLVLGCGGLGSFWFVAALLFRVDPPEIRKTEAMDAVISILLAVATVALVHLIRLPARIERAAHGASPLALLCYSSRVAA